MAMVDRQHHDENRYHFLQYTSFLLLGCLSFFSPLGASVEGLQTTTDIDSPPIETRRSVLRRWINDGSLLYNNDDDASSLALGWAIERRLVLTEAQTRVGGPKITPDERWHAMIDESGVCDNNNKTPIHHYGEMNGVMQIISEWSNDAVEYDEACSGLSGKQTTGFTLPDNRQRQSKAGGVISGALWNSAVAGSILFRSPRIRSALKGKDMLELGSGLGLGGLAASTPPWKTQRCILTDRDDEALEELRATVERNAPTTGLGGGQCAVGKLDWYDYSNIADETTLKDKTERYDVLIATDVTYNPLLVGPFLKTAQAHLGGDCLMIIIGQANRKSHWDLHRCLQEGCYDNETKESYLAWEGETAMLLYELLVGEWEEEEDYAASDCTGSAFPRQAEEVVEIAVIVHTCNADTMSSLVGLHDHIDQQVG